MNSQHRHTHIAQNLKCFILVVDSWVINTLYTTIYLPMVFRNNKDNNIFAQFISIGNQTVLFSTVSSIINNISLITNIKNLKTRRDSIFSLIKGNRFLTKYTNHHILLEWVWTLVPLLIMTVILFISLILLYSAYASGGIWITTYIIKIIGNQWFWTYEVLNNITNIHYIDFYAHAIKGNVSILFSFISNSLPHIAYSINSLPESISSQNDEYNIYATNSVFVKENISNSLFFSSNTDILSNTNTVNTAANIDTTLKNNYTSFMNELRIFPKSEERLNFYDLINQWYLGSSNSFVLDSNTQNVLPIPNYKNIIFDSNIIKNTYLNKDKPLRLLDVDNRLYLSMSHPIDFYITTNDVIHSYAVPSFGIKLDGLPGRINYGCTYILRPGIYYGQCSELCGINHAYMPTSVVVLDKNKIMTDTKLLEHIHLYNLQY